MTWTVPSTFTSKLNDFDGGNSFARVISTASNDDGSIIVIVGCRNNNFNNTDVVAQRSTDGGLTWQHNASGLADHATSPCNFVIWASSLQLFLSNQDTGDTFSPVRTLKYSADGLVWTSVVNPSDWYTNNACWSQTLGIFVTGTFGVPSNFSTQKTLCIQTSSDGTNWTGRDLPVAVKSINSCAWSPLLGLFAAGGNVAGRMFTSPNGITWTERTTPINPAVNTNSIITRIDWLPINQCFMAMCTSAGSVYMIRSTNGINWSQVTYPNINPGSSNFCELADGSILAGNVTDGFIGYPYFQPLGLCYSNDGGLTFLTDTSYYPLVFQIISIHQTFSGTILVGGYTNNHTIGTLSLRVYPATVSFSHHT